MVQLTLRGWSWSCCLREAERCTKQESQPTGSNFKGSRCCFLVYDDLIKSKKCGSCGTFAEACPQSHTLNNLDARKNALQRHTRCKILRKVSSGPLNITQALSLIRRHRCKTADLWYKRVQVAVDLEGKRFGLQWGLSIRGYSYVTVSDMVSDIEESLETHTLLQSQT